MKAHDKVSKLLVITKNVGIRIIVCAVDDAYKTRLLHLETLILMSL